MLRSIQIIDKVVSNISLDFIDYYYYKEDIQSMLETVNTSNFQPLRIREVTDLVMIYKPYNKVLIVRRDYITKIYTIMSYYRTDLRVIPVSDFKHINSDYIAGTIKVKNNNNNNIVIVINTIAIPYIIDDDYTPVKYYENKIEFFIIIYINLVFKMFINGLKINDEYIKTMLLLLINRNPVYYTVYQTYQDMITHKPFIQFLIYIQQLVMNYANYNYKINCLMTDYDYNTQVLNTITNVLQQKDVNFKIKLYDNTLTYNKFYDQGDFIYMQFDGNIIKYYENVNNNLKLVQEVKCESDENNNNNNTIVRIEKDNYKKFIKDAFLRFDYKDYIDFYLDTQQEDECLDDDYFDSLQEQDKENNNKIDNNNNDNNKRVESNSFNYIKEKGKDMKIYYN